MLIVQKFGGTSVGSIERIHNVATRVMRTVQQGHQVVVTVSAMAGETDRLVGLASDVGGEYDHRELDVLLATGEQASAALLSMTINKLGGRAASFLGHQIRVHTDSAHSRARIRQIDATALRKALSEGCTPIVAGFQGTDSEGNITTLGRGGSDTSAVAVAAAIKADVCEILTDVKGVYTTDPGVCPKARLLRSITYQEMLELASLGAKVLQIRSVELASAHNVPIHVRSSLSEEEGTMVIRENDSLEKVVVSGVSLDRNQARVTVRGLPIRPGIQSDIFRPLGQANIIVDMIVQNPPADGKTNLSFTVPATDLKPALDKLQPLVSSLGASELLSDKDVAKVSIVGVGMRSHSGVAQKMFEILAADGIDILMISTSEIKVSCVIAQRYGELAVRQLHAGFGLAEENGG